MGMTTTYTPTQVADEMFEATIEGQGFDTLDADDRDRALIMLAMRCLQYVRDRDLF